MKTQMLSAMESVGRLPDPALLLAQLPRLLTRPLAGRDDRLCLRLARRLGYRGGASLEIVSGPGHESVRVRRAVGVDGMRLACLLEEDLEARALLAHTEYPFTLEARADGREAADRLLRSCASPRIQVLPLGGPEDIAHVLVLLDAPRMSEEHLRGLAAAARLIRLRAREHGESLRLQGENETLRRHAVGATRETIKRSAEANRLRKLEQISRVLEEVPLESEAVLRTTAECLAPLLDGHLCLLVNPALRQRWVVGSLNDSPLDVDVLLREAVARVGADDSGDFETHRITAALSPLRSDAIRGHAVLASQPGPQGERLLWISFSRNHYDEAEREIYEIVARRCFKALNQGSRDEELRTHGRRLRARLIDAEQTLAELRTSWGEAEPADRFETHPGPPRIELEPLLEKVHAGLMVISPTGELSFSNPAARRLLQLEGGLALHVGQLQSRCGVELEHLLEQARRESPALVARDLSVGRQNPRHIRVEALRVHEHDGVDRGTMLVLHDLTRQMQIERKQAEFVHTVSHDLKTPLASMKTAVQLMLKEQTGPITADQHRFLSMTLRNIDRLTRMVGGLLDMARQDTGDVVLHRERVDIECRLGATLDDYAQTTRQKARNLAWRVDHGAVVYADVERLHRIVDNLVGNAVRFTRPGGSVLVTVRADVEREGDGTAVAAGLLGQELRGTEFIIEDDGMGMTPEVRRRAFERFFQAEESHQERAGGTGLGLAITRTLVEAHQGTISIESEPGEGTKVRVWLPASPRTAELAETVRRMERELDRLRQRGRSGHVVVLEHAGMTPGFDESVGRLAVALAPKNDAAWRVLRPHERCLVCVLPASEVPAEVVQAAVDQIAGLSLGANALRMGHARFPEQAESLTQALAIALRQIHPEAAHAIAGGVLNFSEEVSQ